ncbi:hypothetical protein HYU22_05880, partial [Candidatus Woesearchaeota archaeon]|nr:hypothetical protein [Candidatus Woesearchaeota archaeon]
LRTEIEGEAREFMDVALGYVGKNPEETVERNRELLKSAGYEPRIAIARGNDLDRVLQAQKTMKHGFVRRDLRKISDLALLLGFIKSVKRETYEPAVSLYDIAASVGIVLESKKITGSPEGQLMGLVNDALNAYRSIHQQKEGNTRVYVDGFGIRQAVWQAAVHAGQGGGNFDAYRATLQKGVRILNTQTAGVASAALKSRLAADIAVLDHFSREYQGELEKALGSADPFAEWKEVYEKHKSRSSVYEHRLSSIVK